jgi:hypothetical protein
MEGPDPLALPNYVWRVVVERSADRGDCVVKSAPTKPVPTNHGEEVAHRGCSYAQGSNT